jgi:hypothetical protein
MVRDEGWRLPLSAARSTTLQQLHTTWRSPVSSSPAHTAEEMRDIVERKGLAPISPRSMARPRPRQPLLLTLSTAINCVPITASFGDALADYRAASTRSPFSGHCRQRNALHLSGIGRHVTDSPTDLSVTMLFFSFPTRSLPQKRFVSDRQSEFFYRQGLTSAIVMSRSTVL